MRVKNIIWMLGAAIVVGALLRKNFPLAGLIVSLSAVGILLILKSQPAIRNTIYFRRIPRIARVSVLTYLGLLYILVNGIVTGEMNYFLLLLILGIEFFIHDRQR